LVDRQVCTRVSAEVDVHQVLALGTGALRNVSRGAAKLAAALRAFEFDAEGCIALDVGASTGGFTEVLLEGGAKKVYAVDVGHGQLHASLRHNARVVSLEGCDARDLTRAAALEPITAIVADVSFISLTKALGPALALAAPGAWLVALVKPQFEDARVSARVASCATPPRAKAQWMMSPAGCPRSAAGVLSGPSPPPSGAVRGTRNSC
jgi:23S rRNA (cytidine1920-2'-O)/16S rRNA (cytidine1409-2'-O)-methyltransferase